jgi:hypothetical protein
MSTFHTALELVAVLNFFLCIFCAWFWFTGGGKSTSYPGMVGHIGKEKPWRDLTKEERNDRTARILATGTVFIWLAVGCCTILWLVSWIVVRGISLIRG